MHVVLMEKCCGYSFSMRNCIVMHKSSLVPGMLTKWHSMSYQDIMYVPLCCDIPPNWYQLCSKILCHSSPSPSHHDAAPKVQSLSDAVISLSFMWMFVHLDPTIMPFHHESGLVQEHDRLPLLLWPF